MPHEITNFQCGECGKYFEWEEQINMHIKHLHEGECQMRLKYKHELENTANEVEENEKTVESFLGELNNKSKANEINLEGS